MHEPCYTVQEKAQKGKRISEKAVRLKESVQTWFGWESWKSDQPFESQRKISKLGPVFQGGVSPISPHCSLASWTQIFWVWFSKYVCEDQTTPTRLNPILRKYLFWNLKIANMPSLTSSSLKSVARGLYRYFSWLVGLVTMSRSIKKSLTCILVTCQ